MDSPPPKAGPAWLVAAPLVAALVTGCESSPIDREGQRSQFDRHEALRGNYARPYVEDEFGRMIPNLRARLLPKE